MFTQMLYCLKCHLNMTETGNNFLLLIAQLEVSCLECHGNFNTKTITIQFTEIGFYNTSSTNSHSNVVVYFSCILIGHDKYSQGINFTVEMSSESSVVSHIYQRLFTNKMEDTSLYDALELLGPVIMPEFSLVSDILSEFEEELTQSDEELAEAVNVINEAEGYEIDVTRANEADGGKCGRFPSVNDEEKENIIRDTESLATKRQTKYGVNIFRRRCQI